MKIERVRLPSLLLGGVSYYGDPVSVKGNWDSENEIGKTWNRWTAYLAGHPERAYSRNLPVMYEAHLYGDETAAKGYFEVFVGEEVRTAELPPALCAKHFPEADYYRVTLSGEEIVGDWWQTLHSALPTYACGGRTPAYLLQAYDGRFRGMDRIAESVLDAYIPVDPS